MVYHRILILFPVLYSVILLFIHPIYNILHLLIPNSQSFLPCTCLWQLQVCSVYLWVWFCSAGMFICVIFYILHISDIIRYLFLTSLSLIISRSTCVAINGIMSLFFNSWVVFHHIHHLFFILSSGDGHLRCFCVTAVIRSAAMNMRCIYLSELYFCLGIYSGVGFSFWGTSILFFHSGCANLRSHQ